MSCKVRDCLFRYSHVTRGHICEKCYKSGHGKNDCKDSYAQSVLRIFFSESLPVRKRCQVPDCKSRDSHMTIYHYCDRCKDFNCLYITRILLKTTIQEIRRERMRYNRHFRKKQNKPNIKIISCPTCRTNNRILPKENYRVYVDAKCNICYIQNIDFIFPDCRHATICSLCLKKLE